MEHNATSLIWTSLVQWKLSEVSPFQGLAVLRFKVTYEDCLHVISLPCVCMQHVVTVIGA